MRCFPFPVSIAVLCTWHVAAGFSATALSSVSWRPVLLFRHSTSTRSLRTSSLGCLAVLGGPIFDMSAGDGEAEVEDSSEFAVSAAATERCPSDAARRVGDASRLGSSDVLRSSHAAPRWRSVTCREPSGARSPRGWGGGAPVSSGELRLLVPRMDAAAPQAQREPSRAMVP